MVCLGNFRCGDIIWAIMKFAHKKVWDLHKKTHKAEGTFFQAREKKILRRRSSHLGQTVSTKIEDLLWTAAHLST